MAMAGLKTRKPTGRVPWPCILLEGEEKAGKSWALAQFSTSDRIGVLYWIDLNEGAGDEYGAIPGATYELVEHDGSYGQVLAAVQAIQAEARRPAKAGAPPGGGRRRAAGGPRHRHRLGDLGRAQGLGERARRPVHPQPRAAQA